MSKKQLLILIIVLVVGYAITLGGSYFMLKGETDTSMLDSLAIADSLEEAARRAPIDLTKDISQIQQPRPGGPLMLPAEGDSGAVMMDGEGQIQTAAGGGTQTIAEMMDSVATAKTDPVIEDVQETQAQVAEAEEKVDELTNLLAMLSADADSVDQANAKRLSKIIENMRPTEAAAVLNGLGSKTSARLLITMRQRQAAKILAAMPRERAAEVARYLSQAYEKSAI
ncbi:hypothetical protein KQI52_00535 [bacterium]|nr:hypothetical protein [bacterium]